jgi:hypothetical protein
MEEQLQRGPADGFMEGLGAAVNTGGFGYNLGYTDGVNADLDMNAIGRTHKQAQEDVKAKGNRQKKRAVGKVLGIHSHSFKRGRSKQQWSTCLESTAKQATWEVVRPGDPRQIGSLPAVSPWRVQRVAEGKDLEMEAKKEAKATRQAVLALVAPPAENTYRNGRGAAAKSPLGVPIRWDRHSLGRPEVLRKSSELSGGRIYRREQKND